MTNKKTIDYKITELALELADSFELSPHGENLIYNKTSILIHQLLQEKGEEMIGEIEEEYRKNRTKSDDYALGVDNGFEKALLIIKRIME